MARYGFMLIILCLLLSACESSGPGFAQNDPAIVVDAPEGTAVAYLNGKRIEIDDLRPALLEARGAMILAEEVLDRLIDAELAERGLTLSAQQVAAEQQLILDILPADDVNEAQRKFDQIREQRGIGPSRLTAMLRRSAGLRLLVRDAVEVTDEDIFTGYELLYGTRYRGRLITVDSSIDASDLVERARRGESFIDLALAHSTDVSKAQGGVLPLISPLDTTFPPEIRKVLGTLRTGGVSDPIPLEAHGYAIIKLDEKIEGGTVSFDDVKDNIAVRLRRRQEKLRQDKLAREMVAAAKVIVLDPALKSTWQRKLRQMHEGR